MACTIWPKTTAALHSFSGLDSSDTLNLKHYYRPGSLAMDSSHLISQHDSTPTFYEVSIHDILSSADPQNFSTTLDTATAIGCCCQTPEITGNSGTSPLTWTRLPSRTNYV
ncbi:unnamed protein product [Cercospora beticola]|nr:unnamed protein product [Cercospora beticola]